ncbi:hypothetical protein [Leeuwenhoekiella marinoflava]|uniref:Uncharacterized protein n=2 Tax=Leeuwenhoekiella marinoflava TaxID=988 RepID=A0A4Q0PR86_9FLAO|nr:hypothetical protein [Leeuwenhoekiella marinoflava]RXG33111.1 hypothetical protein DSL99_206 [Leeuwenhoekiella marinoflava]SHE38768.1 hypothetical protein SAMN02745246_00264 [Leeuwenhoekiella marinoflava DSM 3653]
MKKYIVIAILLIALAGVAYLTFVIAAIKIVIGSIFLGIMAIALLALWIMWKVNDD